MNFFVSSGPESELSYWRRRMSHLTSLEEQLQSGEHRCVVAVCTAAEVPACARWRQLDLQLTEAAAEAAETVKYLGSLEDSLACLYTSAWLLVVGAGLAWWVLGCFGGC